MKRSKSVILLIVIITLSACQFNQSVKKDLTTGAYSRGDGIGSDDVIIEISGVAENRNEFVYGEKVNLVFNDVTGLTLSEGKTYPGLSLHIVKNEQDTVLSKPNLLKSLDDGTDFSPLKIQAYFRTNLPYKNSERYTALVKIWDKKGDGEFIYELPFTIKENDLLDIKSNGIEYSTIYLWNETLKQGVFDKNISSEHLFILIFNQIEGLELANDKVFPILSVDLTDKNGNTILSSPNLLSKYEEIGVNPQDMMKNQLSASLELTKTEFNNPCRLSAKLKDKNSNKEINIQAELNIN